MGQVEEGKFEEKLNRLEEIVSLLENPEISLDKSMELYREGILCSQFCREKLEKARHELEIWQENNKIFEQEDQDG